MMQFPATNFHDLNLDWMLQQIKTMLAEWQEMQTDFTTLQGNFDTIEADWQTEKTWMHNYVQTNLPIEVQALFDAFIETTTFQQIVAGAVSDELVESTIDAWLEDNISQETGYVLDNTLTLSNAAAPGKTVGARLNDITEGRYTIPANLANGVEVIPGSRGCYISSASGSVELNSSSYPRITKITGLIDISGHTKVVYSRLSTSYAGNPAWGMAFYKDDGTTFVSGQMVIKNQPDNTYVYQEIDVPTYEVEGSESPVYAKYMRFTLKYELDQIPVVYDADEYANSIYKTIETNTAAIATHDTAIARNWEYIRPVTFPAKGDYPIEVLHRGMATAGWPENVIVTYKHAIDLGWKWLETDLRRTYDGVWVLCHDSTINGEARNPDGSTISTSITVADSTYAELLNYDFGIKYGSQFAGTKIATLEELLILCKMTGTFPHIGIKNNSDWQYLQSAIDLADKYDMMWRSEWGCASVGGVSIFINTPKYKHTFISGINDGHGDGWSGWSWIDPENFGSKTFSVNSYLNGQNTVAFYWDYHYFPADATHTSIEIQDNFIDWCHYWGLLAGAYSPTTEAGFATLSPRFDVVMGEVYHYREIMTSQIPTTLP